MISLLKSIALSTGFIALTGCQHSFNADSRPAIDLSGHWQGQVENPQSAMGIEMDIERDSNGNHHGTMSQVDQNLRGLPLLDVRVENQEITILAREDQPLVGTLSEDGQTFTGAIYAMNFEIPVTLTRNGAARFATPTVSAAVDQRFTGEWHANMVGNQIVLRVANHADNSATAELVNLSQGGLRIPAAAIAAEGLQLQLDLSAVGGSFTGELSSDGQQIAGSYLEGTTRSPLSFVRHN